MSLEWLVWEAVAYLLAALTLAFGAGWFARGFLQR